MVVLLKQSLEDVICFLKPLREKLKGVASVQEKSEVFDQLPSVRDFLEEYGVLRTFLAGLSPECELAIKAIIAIGQGPIVFNIPDDLEDKFERLRLLLQDLLEVEEFYSSVGGIVGYHVTVLELLRRQELGKRTDRDSHICYHRPEGIDLLSDRSQLDRSILNGLEFFPHLAEFYPLGGAGDRLGLTDVQTGQALPAAMLAFQGRSLFEGLIRDLQAREYLYYKIFAKQLLTPVAIMTSQEKNNHRIIESLLEEKHWFSRPKNHFFLFSQSSMPVITKEGNWSLRAPLQLTLKPGGHGSIWKFAKDKKVFDWLRLHGRKKALIRQINNPIAGTDYNLLAFSGIGCREDKVFGFASCHRIVGLSEGVNVLKETRMDRGAEYSITNVEYTDFIQKGIEDTPSFLNPHYSRFPSNTNILFADLDEVESLAEKHPIPGMLVNVKNIVPCMDQEGKILQKQAGRLESTMQNIADYIVEFFPQRLLEGERNLKKTFLTYNERRKTISVTKYSCPQDKIILETPESCYNDCLRNYWDLLSNYCNISIPKLDFVGVNVDLGRDFVCYMHPALGPLYSLIAQKIRGGSFCRGAELQLEIAELDMKDTSLDGSLLIKADSVMGKKGDNGYLKYSEFSGKCFLHNVRVSNKGIDREANNVYWKDEIVRLESLEILLQGNGEFYAKDVFFEGAHRFEVPDGMRMIVTHDCGKLLVEQVAIEKPSWYWEYCVDNMDRIKLKSNSR